MTDTAEAHIENRRGKLHDRQWRELLSPDPGVDVKAFSAEQLKEYLWDTDKAHMLQYLETRMNPVIVVSLTEDPNAKPFLEANKNWWLRVQKEVAEAQDATQLRSVFESYVQTQGPLANQPALMKAPHPFEDIRMAKNLQETWSMFTVNMNQHPGFWSSTDFGPIVTDFLIKSNNPGDTDHFDIPLDEGPMDTKDPSKEQGISEAFVGKVGSISKEKAPQGFFGLALLNTLSAPIKEIGSLMQHTRDRIKEQYGAWCTKIQDKTRASAQKFKSEAFHRFVLVGDAVFDSIGMGRINEGKSREVIPLMRQWQTDCMESPENRAANGNRPFSKEKLSEKLKDLAKTYGFNGVVIESTKEIGYEQINAIAKFEFYLQQASRHLGVDKKQMGLDGNFTLQLNIDPQIERFNPYTAAVHTHHKTISFNVGNTLNHHIVTHEWFHALDNKLANDVYKKGMLDLQKKLVNEGHTPVDWFNVANEKMQAGIYGDSLLTEYKALQDIRAKALFSHLTLQDRQRNPEAVEGYNQMRAALFDSGISKDLERKALADQLNSNLKDYRIGLNNQAVSGASGIWMQEFFDKSLPTGEAPSKEFKAALHEEMKDYLGYGLIQTASLLAAPLGNWTQNQYQIEFYLKRVAEAGPALSAPGGALKIDILDFEKLQELHTRVPHLEAVASIEGEMQARVIEIAREHGVALKENWQHQTKGIFNPEVLLAVRSEPLVNQMLSFHAGDFGYKSNFLLSSQHSAGVRQNDYYMQPTEILARALGRENTLETRMGAYLPKPLANQALDFIAPALSEQNFDRFSKGLSLMGQSVGIKTNLRPLGKERLEQHIIKLHKMGQEVRETSNKVVEALGTSIENVKSILSVAPQSGEPTSLLNDQVEHGGLLGRLKGRRSVQATQSDAPSITPSKMKL